MSNPSMTPPYKNLGIQLLRLRQSRQETVAEVSGAVEIEPSALERMEQGVELPTEDILLLLISHFNIRDDEAVRLWEMAGYDHDERGPEQQAPHAGKQPVLMVLGLDSRIVYSNGINVSADPSGVVMSFMQYADPTQQAVAVSRVGMSREQAEQVLETLQQALLRDKYASGPKSLPAPKQKPKTVNRSRKKSGNADK
jgi:transcriptional regulator with XRE-family HTH domain